MAGQYTRKMYDNCALQQDTKQSTGQLELILDPGKYVNCHNLCQPKGMAADHLPNGALLVDVESSLRGIDRIESKCDSAKYPFCEATGCLLTNDPRVSPHMTPYACDWGHAGEKAVVNTNMRMPNGPGYVLPPPNPCGMQGNGYYATR